MQQGSKGGRPKGTGAPLHVLCPRKYLPADRIRPIMVDLVERIDRERPTSTSAEGIMHGANSIIAQRTGITTRWVYAVLHGERDSVSLDNVDRIFGEFGLSNLFYLPAEDGGLADLYFHPDVIGDADDVDELLAIRDGLVDLRPPQSTAFQTVSLLRRAEIAEQNGAEFLAASLRHRASLAGRRAAA